MYGVNASYGMIYMVVVALSVYGRNSVALFGGLFYCPLGVCCDKEHTQNAEPTLNQRATMWSLSSVVQGHRKSARVFFIYIYNNYI